MMRTILILDDDKVSLYLCKTILKPLNIKIVTATSGDEALPLVESERPDLLFIDVVMPKMNGFEFVEMIKDKKLYNGPFIMLTGLQTPKNILTALKLGALDYMRKPIEQNVLLHKVKSALGIVRPEDPSISFASEHTGLDTDNTLPARISNISEFALTVQSKYPIEPNVVFSLNSKIFPEIGIDQPALRSIKCTPLRHDSSYKYEIVTGFMGLPEESLKKIREWIELKSVSNII